MITKIEWTEATWNPIAGCSIISEGCRNCYAMKMANRLQAMGKEKYLGTVRKSGDRVVWTGKVNFDDDALMEPLKRKKPTRYFVNSMSDLFHENVPDEWIDQIFAIMALCPHHTFQVLTKRPERMREYFKNPRGLIVRAIAMEIHRRVEDKGSLFPLPNVWLGVSVEDQETADKRIPLLLDTPAAIRWVSAEPLLGYIDFRSYLHDSDCEILEFLGGSTQTADFPLCSCSEPREVHLDWGVVGGESGHSSRCMDARWAMDAVFQFEDAKVPVFFKQWGDHNEDGKRVGKKAAGRILNGRTYDEYPRVVG